MERAKEGKRTGENERGKSFQQTERWRQGHGDKNTSEGNLSSRHRDGDRDREITRGTHQLGIRRGATPPPRDPPHPGSRRSASATAPRHPGVPPPPPHPPHPAPAQARRRMRRDALPPPPHRDAKGQPHRNSEGRRGLRGAPPASPLPGGTWRPRRKRGVRGGLPPHPLLLKLPHAPVRIGGSGLEVQGWVFRFRGSGFGVGVGVQGSGSRV